MSYVYVKSEPGLWTAGFYDPKGGWHSESDYHSTEDAAERVHYLNGGNATDFVNQLAALRGHAEDYVNGEITLNRFQDAIEAANEKLGDRT